MFTVVKNVFAKYNKKKIEKGMHTRLILMHLYKKALKRLFTVTYCDVRKGRETSASYISNIFYSILKSKYALESGH